ncbi:zona pellucida sperm-binding protein 3 receptor-like isoform X2 [Eptesicus fuscus]|uniref:zona pellucida sperm-binding protein 3 receptor-like isoform X2 n=1 Tax=Eptesicus fuscus TaxID=29078 RepID=UPI0024042291|nr:zona pellucida sperm-binding protein 3 receptor-like isoform X2 [Eptesicus fuscus]
MPPTLQSILPALYLLGVLTLLLCPSGLCEVCCPVPELKYGKIILQRQQRKGLANKCEYFYGDSISYSCDGSYNSEASCQEDGTWSPETPACGETVCPTPEIEHGNLLVDKDQFVETEIVTIQCDSGYSVVGPQNITCLEDRTWYPEVPKCEWLEPCLVQLPSHVLQNEAAYLPLALLPLD